MLREIEAAAHVAAGFAVVVEAQGGDEVGALGEGDVVFGIHGPFALRGVAAAAGGDAVEHIGAALVGETLAVGRGIFQMAVGEFGAHGQSMRLAPF